MNLRMRSRCLDRLRSADRSRTIRSDDAAALAVVPATVPPSSGDQTTVLRALESLSPEQRRVLELGYFAGMSMSEIAEVVGVSVGTVKSRTAAALGKLRARFATPAGESR
jgi:RNA polymerase sigma-70 factor (ECF subfamily)